jgi:hypothetical protein
MQKDFLPQTLQTTAGQKMSSAKLKTIADRFLSSGPVTPVSAVQNTGSQLRTLWPTMLWAYVPAVAVLGGVGVLALATGRRVWYFTNDLFVLGHLPFYAGLLSTLGNVLWGAGATICFFSSGVLPEGLPWRRFRRFLFFSGLLTALLLFDDLFQFHRILYIKYLHLSTAMVFAVYGMLAFGHLIYFRKEIARTDYLLLAVALVLLAAAVVFDTVSLLPRGRTAFSDGLKFLGITTWVAYFVRTGRQMLQEALKSDLPQARQEDYGQKTGRQE